MENVGSYVKFFVHKYGGMIRALIWYHAGDWKVFSFLNTPGAHLIVHATETDQILCTHPASEWGLAKVRGIGLVCHPPGGGRKKGEGAETALIRECAEELGHVIDLSQARKEETVMQLGKLRNPITFFLITVNGPEDFPVSNPRLGAEFLAPHTWRDREYGGFRLRVNTGMRTGLEVFNLW